MVKKNSSLFQDLINIVFIILLILININTHDLFYIFNRSRYLAFNINTNEIYSNKQIDNYYLCVEGLTNVFFRKQFLELFNIDKYHSKQNRTNIIHIYNIINNLKKSGFIKSIKISSNFPKSEKIFLLNIQTNSIIKTVKVFNINSLLIPKTFISHLFNRQIGLPRNYINIYTNLNKIKNWYSLRGFKWAKIKIKQKRKNELYIQIDEGKIKENQFICKNKKNVNQDITTKRNLLIQKELNIKPSNIINLQQIESGILNLKEKKIIKDCHYTVIHDSSNLMTVIFSYNLNRDKFIYFFTKNIGLIHLFKWNWFQVMKYMFHMPIKKIYSIFFALNQYLGLQYYSYKANDQKNNLKIDLRNINDFIHFNYIYSYPYINIYKNITGDFLIYLLNRTYKLHKFITIPSIKIDNLNTYKSIDTFEYHGLKIIFTHNPINNTYLEEKLTMYNNIHVNKYLNLKKYNYSSYSHNLIKKKIFKKAKQTLISFQSCLKHNTFNFNNNIKSGKLLIFNFQHIINFSTKALDSLYFLNYCGHNLYIKYQEIFIIPNIIHAIKKNSLTIFLESNLLMYYINYLHIIEEKFLLNNLHLLSSFFSTYKISIEYQITNSSYYTLYSYIDYKNKIFFSKESTNLVTSYMIEPHKGKTLGIGVEINIPINRFPSFRLEYVINDEKHFCQIKSSYKDNN